MNQIYRAVQRTYISSLRNGVYRSTRAGCGCSQCGLAQFGIGMYEITKLGKGCRVEFLTGWDCSSALYCVGQVSTHLLFLCFFSYCILCPLLCPPSSSPSALSAPSVRNRPHPCPYPSDLLSLFIPTVYQCCPPFLSPSVLTLCTYWSPPSVKFYPHLLYLFVSSFYCITIHPHPLHIPSSFILTLILYLYVSTFFRYLSSPAVTICP